MKFGDLLEEKRRESPEDFAPYYVRCAPCNPPWARSPATVPAPRRRAPRRAPPHLRLRAGSCCLFPQFGAPRCCSLQRSGRACKADSPANRAPLPRPSYGELKALLKKLPPHSADGDTVSRQVSLNRRLTPSGARDEVVRARLARRTMCRLRGIACSAATPPLGCEAACLAPEWAQALARPGRDARRAVGSRATGRRPQPKPHPGIAPAACWAP